MSSFEFQESSPESLEQLQRAVDSINEQLTRTDEAVQVKLDQLMGVTERSPADEEELADLYHRAWEIHQRKIQAVALRDSKKREMGELTN